MVQGGNTSDVERKVISILKVLSESSEPLGSITIARELERYGIFLSERAVRYHLRITDERGYTKPLGRGGRMITPVGLEELKSALAPEQVGFIIEKLELLAFRTTFDPVKHSGGVPINTSLFNKDQFKDALVVMKEIFKAGLAVSESVVVASEGEKLGNVVIPHGKIGMATVCSVVVNGVLLKAGVPILPKFGGVLEIKDRSPRRFTAIINYDGTSLDPSEQYMRAKMTQVIGAARTGNGRILANFREVPALARSVVEERVQALKDAGMPGVYVLGNTSEPVCRIHVALNRVGMVLLGGLNPVAAAAEAGFEVESVAESGLVDYDQLVSIWKM
ncbi:MAG: NrpR regulatory domain-containing protein [Dehalococcoidales bacterium]|nr:NrpR regulatory domain-containing protein [Dehalococcoidales bacterium]